MYSQAGAILRADLRGVVEETFLQSELYIGPKVLPPLPVSNRTGQYPVIKKAAGNLLRNEAKPRGASADYGRITRAYETDTYTCIEYGFETAVDDSNRADVSRFFDLQATETRFAARQLQLAHELRVASAINDPATFSLSTSATAYTAANLASFDIGLDIDLAKQEIQSRGENTSDLTVVMSLPVFLRARASTRLQNRIRGTISTDSQLVLNEQAMADALEVKQVLVGRATYDTSAQGAATSTLSNIWSNSYIWVGNVASGGSADGFFNGSVGHTLFWNEDASIFQVESYREERIRSEIIRARHNVTEKIVLAPAAQLLVTQYS